MNDTCSAGVSGSNISAERFLTVTDIPDSLDHLIEIKVRPHVILFWTLTSKSSV